MKKFEQYTDLADEWEPEARAGLGQEEQYVKKASSIDEQRLEVALGLQMISIRLQKSLIDDLKVIANANGIGYQPLIRDVLSRFARSEIQNIMRDAISRQQLEAEHQAIKSRA
jgi:predicted DNA binding CopG/RHH family protein